MLLFALVLVWAGDIAAYFTGTLVGHTPMAPQLSPKKTWEGAAGNVLASLLVAYAFAGWLDADAPTLMVVGGIAGIAGQCGDLLESAYKRGARSRIPARCCRDTAACWIALTPDLGRAGGLVLFRLAVAQPRLTKP